MIFPRIAYTLDPTRKTTFKFLVGQANTTARVDAASGLSDTIPDVRSLFYIRGKRYICEKLTCTFTENGMSDLVRRVFWLIND